MSVTDDCMKIQNVVSEASERGKVAGVSQGTSDCEVEQNSISKERPQDHNGDDKDTDSVESGSSTQPNSSSASQHSDVEWSISFEQFLANVANEERLVNFFERSLSVAEEVQKLRKRQAVSTNGGFSAATTPS